MESAVGSTPDKSPVTEPSQSGEGAGSGGTLAQCLSAEAYVYVMNLLDQLQFAQAQIGGDASAAVDWEATLLQACRELIVSPAYLNSFLAAAVKWQGCSGIAFEVLRGIQGTLRHDCSPEVIACLAEVEHYVQMPVAG